jgi:translation initiation factor IF-2
MSRIFLKLKSTVRKNLYINFIKLFLDKHTQIAGCEVELGMVNNHGKYRVIRDDKVLKIDLKIGSLKQNKENAHLIREGEECGIVFENYDDLKAGDIVDCYEINPKYEGILNTKDVVQCY